MDYYYLKSIVLKLYICYNFIKEVKKMSKHAKTEIDILEFNKNYPKDEIEINEAMKKRLEDLHKMYDEVQGYSTMILNRTNDDNRYLILKYIAGFALVMSKQQDWVLDDFMKYGKRNTAFWQMLKFELDLRKNEKGHITEKEMKDLNARLNPYNNTSAKINKPTQMTSRIGTCILYPMMAIAHNYASKSSNKEDLKTFVNNFKELNLDVDVTPIFNSMDNVDNFLQITKDKSIDKSTYSPIPKRASLEAKNDEIQTSSSPNSQAKKTNNVSHKEAKFVDSQEFIDYATKKFMNADNFFGVPVNKFAYSETKSIGGKSGNKQVISPFASAETPEDVKRIFTSLNEPMRHLFIQHIYKTAGIEALKKDIKNFVNLDTKIKTEIRAICEKDETLNEIIDKKEKQWQKEKNKALRRLISLSKKYDELSTND